MWQLNNTLMNNQWVKERNRMEIKIILRKIKIETEHPETYRWRNDEREVYSDKHLN